MENINKIRKGEYDFYVKIQIYCESCDPVGPHQRFVVYVSRGFYNPENSESFHRQGSSEYNTDSDEHRSGTDQPYPSSPRPQNGRLR